MLRDRVKNICAWLFGSHPKIVALTDWVAKILTCGAIVVGGVWTYHLFNIYGEGDASLSLSISADIQDYSNGLKLLTLHVRPGNVGKSIVEVGGKKGGDFKVRIKKVPEDISDHNWVDRDNLSVLREADILRHYPGGYVIEPNVSYDEVEVIPVTKGIYFVEAVLNLGPDLDDDYYSVANIVKVE